MKGNSEVVQHLNKLLANEQTAFNQYLLNSQLLKNWGIAKMAATERDGGEEEVGHAEQLIDRILYLEGTPKMEGGQPSQVSADVREVLQRNLELEVAGIADLREGIAAAERSRRCGQPRADGQDPGRRGASRGPSARPSSS